MGEAMAPASGSKSPGGVVWCRRQAEFSAGCSRSRWRRVTTMAHAARSAGTAPGDRATELADPATGMTTELDGIAPEFGDAVIAELAGDEAGRARRVRERRSRADAPAPIAARAALHLAQSTRAPARAATRSTCPRAPPRSRRTTPRSPRASRRSRPTSSRRAAVVDLRGPKPVPSSPASIQSRRCVRARRAPLVRVHAIRPHRAPRDLGEGGRDRRGRRDVSRDPRQGRRARGFGVRRHQHRGARADRRRLSDRQPVSRPRARPLFGGAAELRGRALAYLKIAATAYRASLAGRTVPEAELWRLAAETDLRNARDVLAAAGATD